MAVKITIDGQLFDQADARVSVFDRGFLYGDSVYEVMRTSRGGVPVDLDRHLARLARSGEMIGLDIPSEAVVRGAITDTLSAARNAESYIRVIVTRGAGEIGLDVALADRPSLITIVRPLTLPSAEQYQHGAQIRIVAVQRTSRSAIDPAVKSGNYLNNILALAEARRGGAYEAIMCDASGRVAEGSTSNVFVVRAGRIQTPALEVGLLAGITRQRVIDLATGDRLPVDELSLRPDDVRTADEVFLTSSIRGVLPVRCVDDSEITGPVPGPVTARLIALYAAFLDS